MFKNVYLGELLDAMLERVTAINYKPAYSKDKISLQTNPKDKITLEVFYDKIVNFLDDNNTLVAETGSTSLNITKYTLPEKTKYHNQTLWGSIGWATPALLGIALADSDSRAVLVTGEGSHQLTLNDLGVMGRYEINPIIFCINNDGFMVERALELDPDPSYDDLAQLDYTALPKAFGCKDWLAIKVSTIEELEEAMKKAKVHNKGVYIEVITGRYDYGNTLNFFNLLRT